MRILNSYITTSSFLGHSLGIKIIYFKSPVLCSPRAFYETHLRVNGIYIKHIDYHCCRVIVCCRGEKRWLNLMLAFDYWWMASFSREEIGRWSWHLSKYNFDLILARISELTCTLVSFSAGMNKTCHSNDNVSTHVSSINEPCEGRWWAGGRGCAAQRHRLTNGNVVQVCAVRPSDGRRSFRCICKVGKLLG